MLIIHQGCTYIIDTIPIEPFKKAIDKAAERVKAEENDNKKMPPLLSVEETAPLVAAQRARSMSAQTNL